jgi:hypothetical protein
MTDGGNVRKDGSGSREPFGKSGGWLKPVKTTPAPTNQVKPGGLPKKEK